MAGELSQLSQIKFTVRTTLSWLPVLATAAVSVLCADLGGSQTGWGWQGL